MTGYALQSSGLFTGATAKTLPVFPKPLLSSSWTNWWDAKRLPLDSGDPVTSWTDEIGGVILVQSTSSKQPLLQRRTSGKVGAPYVRFDGADDTISGTLAWDASTAVTVMAVVRYPAGVTTGVLKPIIGNRDATNSDLRVLAALGGKARSHVNGVSLDLSTGAQNLNDTNWHVVIGVFNGASSVTSLDGTEVTGTLGTNSTPSSFFSLAHYGTSFSQLDILSVAYAPVALSAPERAAEVANLRSIHGF